MFERIREGFRRIPEADGTEAAGFRIHRHWGKRSNYSVEFLRP